MNHHYNKQTEPSSDNNGIGSDDDDIMTSITEPFNVLYLQQNIGDVQHEEPPWTEQDQHNDNHINISPVNQLKRDHDIYNGYKEAEVQNAYELKANTAALRMENKRLRSNDKCLQQQLTEIQYAMNIDDMANDNQLHGDDESISNIARSSVSPQSQQNDINDNKDHNEAEIEAPTQSPLPCIDTAATETLSLNNNVLYGVYSIQLPRGQILTSTDTKVLDNNDKIDEDSKESHFFLNADKKMMNLIKESLLRDQDEKDAESPVDSNHNDAVVSGQLFNGGATIDGDERQIFVIVCGYCCRFFDENILPKDIIQLIIYHRSLFLKKGIIEDDLNQSNWDNLKLVGSQPVYDPINLKMVMKDYCSVALMRLNNSNNDVIDNLIPIAVIDEQHVYHCIEWVLIVPVIHRNCDVGLAFRYDDKTDVFIATTIYLNKAAMESKHKLTGLQQSFNLKEFQFIDENEDDDDDDEEEEDDAQINSHSQIGKMMMK